MDIAVLGIPQHLGIRPVVDKSRLGSVSDYSHPDSLRMMLGSHSKQCMLTEDSCRICSLTGLVVQSCLLLRSTPLGFGWAGIHCLLAGTLRSRTPAVVGTDPVAVVVGTDRVAVLGTGPGPVTVTVTVTVTEA